MCGKAVGWLIKLCFCTCMLWINVSKPNNSCSATMCGHDPTQKYQQSIRWQYCQLTPFLRGPKSQSKLYFARFFGGICRLFFPRFGIDVSLGLICFEKRKTHKKSRSTRLSKRKHHICFHWIQFVSLKSLLKHPVLFTQTLEQVLNEKT